MECFFGALQLPDNRDVNDKTVVVSFVIPEVGIRFKAPFAAVDPDHAHLAALLALLEFIDGNQKHLPNGTYQIFGNNLRVVNGVNRVDKLPPKFANLLAKAEDYRKKYQFSLSWVPSTATPDLNALFD